MDGSTRNTYGTLTPSKSVTFCSLKLFLITGIIAVLTAVGFVFRVLYIIATEAPGKIFCWTMSLI